MKEASRDSVVSEENRGLELGALLRTIVALVVIPPILLAVSLWAILLIWFGASRSKVDAVYWSFPNISMWIAGTSHEMHGAEHLEEGEAYVVVSNHESNWDPFIIFGLLPVSLRVVLKEEIARVPILGPGLRLTGSVRVGRSSTSSDVASLDSAMASLPEGVSMLFFAEGSRSRDGVMKPFKKGAFVLAIQSGLRILPIAVAGTREIWSPNRARLRRGRACLEIGEPISVEGLSFEDRDALRDQTREAVARLRTTAHDRLGIPEIL